MEIKNYISTDEAKRALFPQMVANLDASMANSLGSTANKLWQIVASESITACGKRLTALDKLTKDVSNEFASTPAGVLPLVHVEVVTGAGAALKNTDNWEQTEITNKYIPVTINRYSRPFALSINELRNAEKIQSKIEAAVSAIGDSLIADFIEVVKDAAPVEVESEALTPEVVATKLSQVFGDAREVSNLVCSYSSYAGLIPTNALSLSLAENVYGVGNITSMAGVNGVTDENTALAIALAKDAIVLAAGRPSFDELEEIGGVTCRELGTVAGIPVILKSWIRPGDERIWCSVEAQAGMSISDASLIKVITPTA